MTSTPFWKSRKFWYTVVDVIVSTATYFVGKYAAPDLSKDILFLIATWQPVVIALIASVAWEDAAAKSAGG